VQLWILHGQPQTVARLDSVSDVAIVRPDFYDRDGSLRRAGKGDLDAMLQELCMQFVRELAEHKMITMVDGFTLAPTQTGHLISRCEKRLF
jgi:hypothetical protein